MQKVQTINFTNEVHCWRPNKTRNSFYFFIFHQRNNFPFLILNKNPFFLLFAWLCPSIRSTFRPQNKDFIFNKRKINRNVSLQFGSKRVNIPLYARPTSDLFVWLFDATFSTWVFGIEWNKTKRKLFIYFYFSTSHFKWLK